MRKIDEGRPARASKASSGEKSPDPQGGAKPGARRKDRDADEEMDD
jgi:hypothetical protein